MTSITAVQGHHRQDVHTEDELAGQREPDCCAGCERQWPHVQRCPLPNGRHVLSVHAHGQVHCIQESIERPKWNRDGERGASEARAILVRSEEFDPPEAVRNAFMPSRSAARSSGRGLVRARAGTGQGQKLRQSKRPSWWKSDIPHGRLLEKGVSVLVSW